MVMLFAYTGFFCGIVFSILSVLLEAAGVGGKESDPVFAALSLILGPPLMSINLAIMALCGYPLYSWFANRYLSQSITGFKAREGEL
jgi:hypothetical protein